MMSTSKKPIWRRGVGPNEPTHVSDEGDCPCSSCDHWRSDQATVGSLIKGYSHRCNIWKPGVLVSFELKMDSDDIGMIIERFRPPWPNHQTITILILGDKHKGFWTTYPEWVITLVKGES